MVTFIIRRLLGLIPTFFIISFIVFVIIQLPPSNWIDRHIVNLALQEGTYTGEYYKELVHHLTERYNLDRPYMVQYVFWILNFIRGDMGESFEHDKEVTELLWKRVPYSLLISLLSLIFVYIVGIPIGIYSALHKYKIGDYVATFVDFIGLSIPNFSRIHRQGAFQWHTVPSQSHIAA